MSSFKDKLYVALVHYPVVNKNNEVISSAVTNLDLHDISRACRTYGVRRFYVVTPLADQQTLIKRLVSHWIGGPGATNNPSRREALKVLRVKDSFDEVCHAVYQRNAKSPEIVVTSAASHPNSTSFRQLGNILSGSAAPLVLVFGTAWGLAGQCLNQADYILEPIEGVNGYNHLSVRSAVSIILDRVQSLMTDE
ncbi:RNA methyltransferase [Desulfococcaceae bacterium HSG9]|nr:RNA methyltransferase [Desulfococcaceae bacterium HSG9]